MLQTLALSFIRCVAICSSLSYFSLALKLCIYHRLQLSIYNQPPHILIVLKCINSVTGSSDIQEDHREEQCQEEEAVWGVYWNSTTAYIIGGKYQFCCPAQCSVCIYSKFIITQISFPLQLSERMKVVDVLSTKVFGDTQQIIAQVLDLFAMLTLGSVSFSCFILNLLTKNNRVTWYYRVI